MYKIGIDARLNGKTGVGVYLRNLLHYLEKIPSDDILFYIYLIKGKTNEVKFAKKNFIKRTVETYWHTFSEQTNFLNILNKDDLDLVHFTYFSYPFLYRKKFVSTIHDTTPLTFKTGRASTKNSLIYLFKYLAFRLVLSSQIKNAKTIITPSITVKNEIVKIYGQKYEKKIQAIHEGVDYKLKIFNKQLPTSQQIYNFKLLIKNSSFFIYVGNFYPHKNVENLIQAFSNIKEKVSLILVGPNDFFSHRLINLINKLKQSNRIFFYHNPSREDMPYFYKNALALIHPSFSEGFGLPLIEAAYFNLPIVASNIPVFKEILDGQFITFDPNNSQDIASKIKNFLKEKNKFDYREILQKYSFEKMADETYKLYLKQLE